MNVQKPRVKAKGENLDWAYCMSLPDWFYQAALYQSQRAKQHFSAQSEKLQFQNQISTFFSYRIYTYKKN
ncbi:hypothetical protein EXN66_Car014512 [Channa argus]|uniref:Uncharacterized protein n=1 Tax=Channa argus TaxID=215402 RepID=A0A6G1Q8F0_CHAAH|nr:hypothetical protein EXN66_Car014512 [Channa argus]